MFGRATDLHAANQPVLDQVGVLHHGVDQDGPGEVADDLLDVYDDSPGVVVGELERLDVRVNEAPLSGPVPPHGRAMWC